MFLKISQEFIGHSPGGDGDHHPSGLADRVLVMAPRPGRVIVDQRIASPRPRSRTDPQLLALYETIWAALQ